MPPRRHNGDDTNSEDANGNANSGMQELANLITGLVNQLTQANQTLNQNRGGANPPVCTFKHFNSCNPLKFTGSETCHIRISMWWDGVWAGRRLDSGVCPLYKHTDLDITCGVNEVKVLPKEVENRYKLRLQDLHTRLPR
ncbi:hypothetical protein E3N88_00248 [Mikania micrantha]|uniref:Uncharacterized protein n=1 Tax=Mikania micrantha TaxID=192012 RepID=A0A5N6PXX8_9ASTR|nr:hypothetical protein E3N88_00248 [Mikania micrantha]